MRATRCRELGKVQDRIPDQWQGRSSFTGFICDDRILLSAEQDWKKWADTLVGAEYYSRNLSHTMERALKTRFRVRSDPGGMAPSGFRPVGPEKQTRLEVDPDSIRQVVELFEKFSFGTWTTEQLAAYSGLHVERIKPILRNRIYNGYVQRHGEWKPAAWRDDPPVSDDLWQQVANLRASRSRGGGPRRTDRIDLLNELLYSGCGQKLWSEPKHTDWRWRCLRTSVR